MKKRRKYRKNPDSNTTLLIVALAAIGAGVFLVMQNREKDDEIEAKALPKAALPAGYKQDAQGNVIDSATGQVIATVKEVDTLLKQATGKGLVDNAKDLFAYLKEQFSGTNGTFVTRGVSGYTDFGDPQNVPLHIAPYGYPQYGYASYHTVNGRV